MAHVFSLNIPALPAPVGANAQRLLQGFGEPAIIRNDPILPNVLIAASTEYHLRRSALPWTDLTLDEVIEAEERLHAVHHDVIEVRRYRALRDHHVWAETLLMRHDVIQHGGRLDDVEDALRIQPQQVAQQIQQLTQQMNNQFQQTNNQIQQLAQQTNNQIQQLAQQIQPLAQQIQQIQPMAQQIQQLVQQIQPMAQQIQQLVQQVQPMALQVDRIRMDLIGIQNRERQAFNQRRRNDVNLHARQLQPLLSVQAVVGPGIPGNPPVQVQPVQIGAEFPSPPFPRTIIAIFQMTMAQIHELAAMMNDDFGIVRGDTIDQCQGKVARALTGGE